MLSAKWMDLYTICLRIFIRFCFGFVVVFPGLMNAWFLLVVAI